MKLSVLKKYSAKSGSIGTVLTKNPVLVLGFDLPFIIACATSLKIAAAFSIEMFIIHTVTMISAMFTVRMTPVLRTPVHVAVSTVTMVMVRWLLTNIFPDITNHVGIYIYLMAVNGQTLYQAAEVGEQHKPGQVLAGAFTNALAFSLTMLLVSLFREILGSGTVWGMAVGLPLKFSGVLMPFCGFIIVGFLLGAARFLNKSMRKYSIATAIRKDARYTEIRGGR